MSNPTDTPTTANPPTWLKPERPGVRWLRHKERKWRDTAQSGVGAAADAASFYAAAYSNAADGVALGQPERWARAERELAGNG